MKLTRITLVNWYLLEPLQIEVQDNVAFLGDNGAGKSSIIDAIQTVLFGGNKRHINLNASSSEKRSNDRDVKSYCLGAFEPVDNDDPTRASRLRDECFSYIALTFTRNDNRYVNLILGIEARESDKDVVYPIRAILSGNKAIGLSDFVSPNQDQEIEVISPELVIQKFEVSRDNENSDFDFLRFTKSGEYLEQLAYSLSPDNTPHKIDPDYLSRVLSKSISLKELSDISHFVDNFILEPDDIDIDRLKSQQNYYEDIKKQIEKTSKQLEDLTSISRDLSRSISERKKSLSLSWMVLEKRLEQEYERQDEQYQLRKDIVLKLRELTRTLKKDESRVSFLEEKIPELKSQIDEDEPQKRKRELLSQIDDLKITEDDMQKKKVSLFALLNEIKASDYETLESSKLLDLVKQLDNALGSNDIVEADKQFALYLDKLESIKEKVDTKKDEVHAQAGNLKIEITGYVNKISSAKKGKPNFSPATRELIAYLKQHNIDAVPVCSLVDIEDISWQPSVEALLSGDLEALIVDEHEETEAYRLYRKLCKTSKFYGAKVIKTSRIRSIRSNNEPGYAAELISSDNAIALKFMQYKLERYKLVKTEEELRDNRFAVTKDGMLSNDVTVTGMRLKQDFKIGKDQSGNIAFWEAEKKRLEEQFLLLEGVKNKLDRIYVTTSKLSNQNEKLSFESIENELDKIGEEINALSLKESAIDLTHLSSLKENLEQYVQEKEALVLKNKENNREIGIQRSDSRTKKELVLASLARSAKLTEEQQQIEGNQDYEESITDDIQVKFEDHGIDALNNLKAKALKRADNRSMDAEVKLRSYQERNSDSFDDNILVLFERDLALLNEKINTEKESIEKYNLAPYEEDARRSEETINTLFKNEVVSELKDKFFNLKQQFAQLNRALSDKEFHSNRYKFIHKPKKEFEPLINHVKNTDLSELQSSGGLFDSTPDEVKEIVTKLMNEDYGNDYRKYFTYDVEIIDVTNNKKKKLSGLLGTGSGGEKQAPFYVAISSALASAWKSMSGSGGAGLALLDEAFNRLDEENLNNAMQFMNAAGIQVLVAAPSDKDLVFKSATETIVYVSREGETVDIDTDIRTEKGWEVLTKDNPRLNPDLLPTALEASV